jgi:hypothetical protein
MYVSFGWKPGTTRSDEQVKDMMNATLKLTPISPV